MYECVIQRVAENCQWTRKRHIGLQRRRNRPLRIPISTRKSVGILRIRECHIIKDVWPGINAFRREPHSRQPSFCTIFIIYRRCRIRSAPENSRTRIRDDIERLVTISSVIKIRTECISRFRVSATPPPPLALLKI